MTVDQLRKGLRQCGILSLGDEHYQILLRAFEHETDPRPVIAYFKFVDAVRGEVWSESQTWVSSFSFFLLFSSF